MDKTLDEILATRKTGSRVYKGTHKHHTLRNQSQVPSYRDGKQRGPRREERDINSDWVHDRFEPYDTRPVRSDREPRSIGRRPSIARDPSSSGTVIRVSNLHYEISEVEVKELFCRIGPVQRIELLYDRAGRSEGTALIVYNSHSDALEAVDQFHGANANGQPISLEIVNSGVENPFESATFPTQRPLEDRISMPPRFSSSPQHGDRGDLAGGDHGRATSGGQVTGSFRRNGRRPALPQRSPGSFGISRDRVSRDHHRTPKTSKELDADMESYFGS